jgi:hypothetical protein
MKRRLFLLFRSLLLITDFSLTFRATHPHKKRIYYFSEGSAEDKAILGNKGAHLCEMSRYVMIHMLLEQLKIPHNFMIQ